MMSLMLIRPIAKRVSYKELEGWYGPGARSHPPYLTRTERLRFFRSYYQLWGFMKVAPAEWQSRFESMTLKQLYQLHEMSKLRQSIGREEVLPPHPFPDAKSGSISATSRGRSQERIALETMIWQRLNDVFKRIYETKAIVIQDDFDEGAGGFVAIWDHFQEPLRGNVSQCNGPYHSPSFVEQYLWDDISDEEV